ncbi:MAG: cadherin-like domain-containing protein, partial [Azoarcus sp.]|nr:cadherin-like domain-containing protein [Azoarcus sp.]
QDGSFEYVPPARFQGEDSFQYQLNDADGSPSEWATVTLNVPGVPVTEPDNYEVVEGSKTLLSSVLFNDANPNATIGKIIAKGIEYDIPANGYAKIPTAAGGFIWLKPDGSFHYDAPAVDNSAGDVFDRFQYCVLNADGSLSDPTDVNIKILDTVPVAVDDAYAAINQTTPVTGNVMDNDVMSEDWFTKGPDGLQNVVLQVRTEDGGTETAITNPSDPDGLPTLTTANGGQVWINQDGSFEYIAKTGFKGNDTFEYQIIDGDDTESNWATVTINVPGGGVEAPSQGLPGSSVPDNPITGGAGLDELLGTDGADVFKWSLADLGDGSLVTNTIRGFNAEEGDALDLRDLLQEGDRFLFDTNHLDVSYNGTDTLITVSPVGASAPTLDIVVANVDLLGSYTGEEAIKQLLDNGNLIDDK